MRPAHLDELAVHKNFYSKSPIPLFLRLLLLLTAQKQPALQSLISNEQSYLSSSSIRLDHEYID